MRCVAEPILCCHCPIPGKERCVVIVILFLITLWVIAFLIWLLWKWLTPGEGVHRPPRGRFGGP